MRYYTSPREVSVRRRQIAMLALVVATSACGSTVPLAQRTALPSTSDSGVDGGTSAPGGVGRPPTSGAGGDRAADASSTGRALADSSGGRAPGDASAPASQQGTSTSGAALPGVDSRHVYVGFPTNNDASSASHNLGLSGLDFGDQVGQVHAVVDELNRRGGLLGRTVVAVVHDMSTASLETNAASQAQATCNALTVDRPVAAVVNIVAAIDNDTFFRCLAKHRTPLFSGGFVPVDHQLLNSYAPFLYKLPAADFDAFGPAWIARLQARGYFGGWDTARAVATSAPAAVGLLYADLQPSSRIFAKLKQELRRRGIAVKAEFAYDASSLSGESSAMSSAVLQFRSKGVTHLLSDASDVQLFMSAADSQGYKPRYGLNSYLAPQLQAGNAPGQLVGSIGVGWVPAADVARTENPGPNPGEAGCRTTMKKAGQDLSSYGVELIAFSLCDGVGLFATGTRAGGSTDAVVLRRALNLAGPRFLPALTFRSGVNANSATLSAAGRDFAWQTSCSCFRYLDRTTRAW
jgi:ABC-type branched-subunit amino acid transport system substrate-binding protein